MGLLKAGVGSLNGVLADQWREFFYCESMDASVLVEKGIKRTSRRSSNTKGDSNIISNGSVIAVNEGQCMMIVEQGKVVEFCAETGEFVYDTSTEPSIFYGKLSPNIKATFATIGKRFTFGGDTAKDQRIYYFNTKEIIGNRYGTPSPVPFRVVDKNIGLDVDIAIRCHGEFSYKIDNPMLFYTNVCGNVEDGFTRDRIDSQLKTELMTALQPAFAKISEMGIRYSALPGHTMELADALNQVLSKKWNELRGLKIVSFGVNSVKASEEDEDMIKQLQRTATFRNPNMAAAHLVGAQAEAMQSAAKNEGAGAFAAFAGVNLAGGAGGMNPQTLFAMGEKERNENTNQGSNGVEQRKESASSGWTCSCGTSDNIGKFCMECGAPKPVPIGWTCSCGTVNKGKFCMECGKKKPAEAKVYKCDKCGWEPENPSEPPKFCPECGDRFDDNDTTT